MKKRVVRSVQINTYVCVCSKGVCVVVLLLCSVIGKICLQTMLYFCVTKTVCKAFKYKVKQDNSHLSVEVAICFRRKGVA